MTTKPRVALFIDAENASAKYVPDYLKRCGELGKLTIARCYGGPAGLKKWDKAMTGPPHRARCRRRQAPTRKMPATSR